MVVCYLLLQADSEGPYPHLLRRLLRHTDVSRSEQALMVAVCLLAIIVELFNSAIEAIVDRISLERHELSKNAKDMGSAAQFVSLSIIFIVWLLILMP